MTNPNSMYECEQARMLLFGEDCSQCPKTDAECLFGRKWPDQRLREDEDEAAAALVS
jgi:hypothetical protein